MRRRCIGKLPVRAIVVRSSEELKSEQVRARLQADLYVDAILGTGFKPPVSGLYADAIAIMNASQAPVIAVDIPSGADADAMGPQAGTIARADAIVTFTAPRPAHVFSLLTRGRPSWPTSARQKRQLFRRCNLNVITARDIAPLIGPRPAESNKGNYGHVLVVGGSVGKAGAAAMAGMSALRAGAGLSTVATPKSVLGNRRRISSRVDDRALAETDAGTISGERAGSNRGTGEGEELWSRMGPGISRDAADRGLGAEPGCQTPPARWSLDADGLNAFEGRNDRIEWQGADAGDHAASGRDGAAGGMHAWPTFKKIAWAWRASSRANTNVSSCSKAIARWLRSRTAKPG